MTTKTIGPVKFELTSFEGKPLVNIYIDGAYWDTKFFDSEYAAESFMDDPLKDERPEAEKDQPLDTRFLDAVEIKQIYRRTT